MEIKEMMSSNVVTVDREETVAAAARLMSRRNIGVLPVTGPGGKLVGMLTDRDITVRCVAAGFDPDLTRVRTVMSAGAVTVGVGESPQRAARTMGCHQVRRLPVTENGRLVGILTQGDFARNADFSVEAAQAFCDVFDPIREE